MIAEWKCVFLLLLMYFACSFGAPWDKTPALKGKSKAEVKHLLSMYVDQSVKDKVQLEHGTGNPDVDRLISLGVMYMNVGLIEESIEINRDLIKRYPSIGAPYLALGTLYAEQNQFGKALSYFSKGISETSGKVVELFERRCQIYIAMDQYEPALDDINKVLEKAPNTEAHFIRGSIFLQLKNPRRAILDAKIVLKEYKNHEKALQLLGMALYDTGDCVEAISVFEKIPTFNAAMTAFRIATAFKELTNYNKSVEYFSKALELDPSLVTTYLYRGQVHYGAGETSSAIYDFTKCVEVDPTNEKCRRPLAIAHHSRGEFDRALVHYNKILKSGNKGLAWYQKVIAQFQQLYLDEEIVVMEREMWESLGPFFFRGFFGLSKGTVLDDAEVQLVIPDFMNQKFVTKKEDVERTHIHEFDQPQQQLLRLAFHFGKKLQVNAAGFFPNKRQFKAMGLAIIEVAQWVTKLLKSSNFENITYRSLYNIAVKWRQYSEPNDAVFWVDTLVIKEWDLEEEREIDDEKKLGLGLSTPLVSGQVKQVRYYIYFEKVFETMKKEMARLYSDDALGFLVTRAANLSEVYSLVQKPFWVVTHVNSITNSSKQIDGARIFLGRSEPEGFDFTIQNMGTKARWIDYDVELSFLFKAFLDEGSKPFPDLEKYLQNLVAILEFDGGTAVVGQATLIGLLYSIGIEVDNLPPNTLPDWEAFVLESADDYVDIMKPIVAKTRTKPNFGDEAVPDVAHALHTLRKMIQAMNYDS